MELKPVTLKIRWTELFGKKKSDMSSETKKERWQQWLNLANRDNESDLVEYWKATPETCLDCKNNADNWCSYADLPCTVNPILTFNHAIKGLACQGIGFKNNK